MPNNKVKIKRAGEIKLLLIELYWHPTVSHQVPFISSALLHHTLYIILWADKMMLQCTGKKWYSAKIGCTPVVKKQS